MTNEKETKKTNSKIADFVFWFFLLAILSHVVLVQVFNYKTYAEKVRHHSEIELMEAEYKAESIRVSEDFNDIFDNKYKGRNK